MCSFRLGWVNIFRVCSGGRVWLGISNVLGRKGMPLFIRVTAPCQCLPLTSNLQYVFFVQQADCSTTSVKFVLNKTG